MSVRRAVPRGTEATTTSPSNEELPPCTPHGHRGARPRQDLSGAGKDPRQGARRPDPHRSPAGPSSPSSARTARARPPPSRSSPPWPRPDEGTRRRRGHRRHRGPGPGPPGHRRRRPALGRRPGGHRPGEPDPAGAPVRHARPGRRRRRADELLDRFQLTERGRAVRPHLLRRHAAPPRRRPRPGPPAPGAVPRRADHRPRPGVARRDVGRDHRPGHGRTR